MICSECGREMPETDKFCVICGAPNPLLENAEEPAQEYAPYANAGGDAAGEYRPYDSTDMTMSGGKAKVKRTCSLSAVVFCGIVIFLLSVACGIFAGLYFSARTAAVTMPAMSYSAAEYRES